MNMEKVGKGKNKSEGAQVSLVDTIATAEAVVASTNAESDISTEGSSSKDENANTKMGKKEKKSQKTSSSSSASAFNTRLLDLPDRLISHILDFVPLPKENCTKTTATTAESTDGNTGKKPGKARFLDKFKKSKNQGGVSLACKRLHRLSVQRKKKKADAEKTNATRVVLPVRNLEIPVGLEQLRVTWGGSCNPSEHWTNCYNSIDKIIRYVFGYT